MNQSTWAGQSPVTDPGAAGTAIDELPGDLAGLCQASSQLVFHYRAGGDFAAKGVPAERVSEIDTRYADAMLAHVLGRGEPVLTRVRMPPDRVVGCCRDTTVLFLALLRHKGIPARARVGFAAYFRPGWLMDHVPGRRPAPEPPIPSGMWWCPSSTCRSCGAGRTSRTTRSTT